MSRPCGLPSHQSPGMEMMPGLDNCRSPLRKACIEGNYGTSAPLFPAVSRVRQFAKVCASMVAALLLIPCLSVEPFRR